MLVPERSVLRPSALHRFVQYGRQAAIKRAPLSVETFNADHRGLVASRDGFAALIGRKGKRFAARVERKRLSVGIERPIGRFAGGVGEVEFFQSRGPHQDSTMEVHTWKARRRFGGNVVFRAAIAALPSGDVFFGLWS